MKKDINMAVNSESTNSESTPESARDSGTQQENILSKSLSLIAEIYFSIVDSGALAEALLQLSETEKSTKTRTSVTKIDVLFNMGLALQTPKL
jgi:hypothetical protein